MIVLHDQRNDSLVALNSAYDFFEVVLQLVARQIKFLKVRVLSNEVLADDGGGSTRHALVVQIDAVVALVHLHLSHEPQLLLV